ncbi:hypothetical protein B0H14DRAFT_2650380 [Mycena olivaceomarginata]|nr:hypothetical protein B0H14DRAFT_2650380 [Mycena olivaceomarginata]
MAWLTRSTARAIAYYVFPSLGLPNCALSRLFQLPLSPNPQLTDSIAGHTLRNGKTYAEFVEDAEQSTLLCLWKENVNVQSEPKASPWSWNHTPKANEKVHKKAGATKVAATSRTRTKAEQMENEEPEVKAAAIKNWRRPSPKVKKMAEPKEEGELVKLFRQQKETGGGRVPLGAVDTNVASSSASTDKQGTRWPRRIFVPPVVEGSVPSRSPRIAAVITGLRALEKVRGGWCWGLALGEKNSKKFL